VILVGLAVVVLGTYVPLMLTASSGNRGAGIVGALEGVLFVAGTGFATLVALYYLGAKCDESCDENLSPEVQTGEWWHTLDAWQWNAQAALAGVALAAAACAVILPILGKYRAAIVVVVLGLSAFCAWALLVAPLGEQFGI
jgi:hypothetical protein